MTFQRENRYVVLKLTDLQKYCSPKDVHAIQDFSERINELRLMDNKRPLSTVVVEHDWPEYEPTWAAIEKRVTDAEL